MIGKRLKWKDLIAGPKAYAFYDQFIKKVDLVDISNVEQVEIDEMEIADAVLEG